jgi:hypothetical protein
MQMRTSALVATCCLFLLAPFRANAQQQVSLSGSLTTYFSSYQSSINSFLLPIQGQLVPSGPVSLTLDLSQPELQVNTFDFDRRVHTVHVDLLLNSPTLQALGFSNLRLRIDETGPITALSPTLVVPGATQAVCVSSTLDSSGVIGPGLLEGWTFSGRKGNDPNGPGQNCPTWRVSSTGQVIEMTPSLTYNMGGTTTASLTSPDGLQIIPLAGTFIARYDISPVPEPTTWLLLVTGIIALANTRSIRRRSSSGA